MGQNFRHLLHYCEYTGDTDIPFCFSSTNERTDGRDDDEGWGGGGGKGMRQSLKRVLERLVVGEREREKKERCCFDFGLLLYEKHEHAPTRDHN